MIKFLDLAKQYESIKSEIDKAIQDVIESSAFIGGKFVAKFETEFANYCQSKYCIGVGNGTDALEIAIEALNMPQQSEIIVPSNSFIASSEAVTRQGHKVVFVDVEPNCYTISLSDIRDKITPNTRAVIAVHLYGHPCDMKQLMEIAHKNNLYIIEDCAQAHGAECHDQKVGSIGHIAAFSFYPGKNLGAYGDAGAITTNDEKLAIKARMIANHGRVAKYDHEFEGRNSRLDGLQASILSVKLKHLPFWTSHRIKIANLYCKLLQDEKNITLPVRETWAKQVYHLFVIRAEQRDHLKEYLNEKGIETGIHYPITLPKLKAYDYLHQSRDSIFANQVSQQLLSLPIGEHVSENDVKKVTDEIKYFYSK